MVDHIKVCKASGTWSVRASGAVLGGTKNALKLSEGKYAHVIYFPRKDIAMAFLDHTKKSTHCSHKGDATYFSVVKKSTALEGAVRSYIAPLAGVEAIKDYLAFHVSDTNTVEST